ncbi:hypothetical protein VNI00_015898 [Paramarasmius palmivorus]|uniref:Uncharacterized protein n=1 Tax=Paramarasmius palmivorus TaxID=297713 RepID=A0AAW0BHZ9_9AGAR
MDWTQLVFIPLSLLIAAVIVPFNGALVRYRAHYNPFRIQLPVNEIDQSSNRSLVTGLFSTIKRVYQIEGWSGLYKWFLPTLLSVTFTWFSYPIVPAIIRSSRLPWNQDVTTIVLFGFITMAVDIPLDILKNRAIVTPYKLPYFNFLTSLRILLSPTERAKPWKLYLLPGLFITYLAKLLVPIAMILIRFLLLAVHEKNDFHSPLFIATAIGCFFFALACSVVHAPLQVIYTRLSIQRFHGNEDASQTEEAQKYGVERYSREDEVIT